MHLWLPDSPVENRRGGHPANKPLDKPTDDILFKLSGRMRERQLGKHHVLVAFWGSRPEHIENWHVKSKKDYKY